MPKVCCCAGFKDGPVLSRGWAVFRRAPQVFTLLLTISAWEVVAVLVRPSWLPTVEAVATSWWHLASTGAFAIAGSTIKTLFIGLVIVFVGAGLITAALVASRTLEEAVAPLLNAVLATPNIALIPVFMFIFGLGDATRVVTVIGFALIPVALDWIEAIKGVPEPLLEMSAGFQATQRARLMTVVIPAASPLLLTGVRIGVVQAIKGVISAEILIGVVGVGKLLVYASLTFDLPELYAVIMTILAASMLSYAALNYLEQRSSRWADN